MLLCLRLITSTDSWVTSVDAEVEYWCCRPQTSITATCNSEAVSRPWAMGLAVQAWARVLLYARFELQCMRVSAIIVHRQSWLFVNNVSISRPNSPVRALTRHVCCCCTGPIVYATRTELYPISCPFCEKLLHGNAECDEMKRCATSHQANQSSYRLWAGCKVAKLSG